MALILNITTTNKSSWNHVECPPFLKRHVVVYIYKKNRRLESIFRCASTRAWWNPIRQRWHHQSWHRPAGKSSGSLRRSLVQVCSSWNSWGCLQNQGSKKCPKIWILTGSCYFHSGGDLRHLLIWDTSLCSQVGLLPSWKDGNRSTRPSLSINKWWPNKNNVLWSLSSTIIQKSTKILQSRSKIESQNPKMIYIYISIFPKMGFFTNAPFHQGSVVRMGFFCNSSALGPSSNHSKWRSPNITSICIDDWYMIMIAYVLYIYTHPSKFGALKIHWFLA